MPKVVNTNLNAPDLVNGEAFELINGKMVSVNEVSADNLAIFSAIPGWIVLGETKAQDAAPALVAPAQDNAASAPEAAPAAPAAEAAPVAEAAAESQDAAAKIVAKKK